MFVNLIHSVWDTDTIPQQMLWTIIILLQKGGGEYGGIGRLKPFWKVIKVVMDTRL